MKKIYFLFPVFILFCGFAVLGTYKTSGGHPSSTGAPGEATCANAQVGCHQGASFTRDSTNLVNSLLFSGGQTYSPGKTYTITVKANKSGIEKFGFEIVALAKNDLSNAGAWTITDANRTHIINGTGSLVSRKYVTHSTNGTPAVSTGLGQWSFDWTAPTTNMGDITFYYCTNCTNNNNASNGEQLFVSNYTIKMEWPAGIAVVKDKKMQVHYDNENRILQVRYHLTSASSASIHVFNSEGKTVQKFDATAKEAGYVEDEFELKNTLSKGIYLVNLEIGGEKITEKILVN
ncbi:MAG: T9SS type A sorting domain-containing protein [Bacteroidetes bacterium]|nr:T9SS type A sorting domain-containing protein [Bacteroidota bacterium]